MVVRLTTVTLGIFDSPGRRGRCRRRRRGCRRATSGTRRAGRRPGRCGTAEARDRWRRASAASECGGTGVDREALRVVPVDGRQRRLGEHGGHVLTGVMPSGTHGRGRSGAGHHAGVDLVEPQVGRRRPVVEGVSEQGLVGHRLGGVEGLRQERERLEQGRRTRRGPAGRREPPNWLKTPVAQGSPRPSASDHGPLVDSFGHGGAGPRPASRAHRTPMAEPAQPSMQTRPLMVV